MEAPATRARKVAQLRRVYPEKSEELLAYGVNPAMYPPTGTIHCLTLKREGRDVRHDDDERIGLEDSRTGGRFADHWRGSVY